MVPPLASSVRFDFPMNRAPAPRRRATTKASSGHDERITPDEIVEQGLLDATLWNRVADATLAVFARGQEVAEGEDQSIARGDPEWVKVTSGHGLFGIVYEVMLDIHAMEVVTVDLVHAEDAWMCPHPFGFDG